MRKVRVEYTTKSGRALGIHFFGVPDNMRKFSEENAKIKLCQGDNFLRKDDLIIRSIKLVEEEK